MKNVFHHVHHHIKKHHKKYLAWFFGGFAVVKLVLLVLWLSAVQYTYTHTETFADLESGCVMTGEYYTGEYQAGCFDVSEERTGWYLIDCVTVPGYFTGGTLNESGDLVGQERIEESQEWCVLTGETIIPAYTTWCYATWGYRTWWTLLCTEGQGTGDEEVLTGEQETGTGDEEIGTGDGEIEINQTSLWNGICESWDVVWNAPVSWWFVRDIFSVSWTYSWTDCLVSWLSLQLRDHNAQWIALGAFASWTTSFAFNSRSLYSFASSGWYHVIGTWLSGQQYYLYTWTYTWTYSRLFTWYTLRLLDASQTSFFESPLFTIDNEIPTITWITLISSWSTTWYLAVSGVVTLNFTASEELSWLQVTLWSGKVATSSSVSWLLYTYTRNMTSLYAEGLLAANIYYADKAGNTWSLVYTSSLVFDITRPVVTWFVFSGTASGLRLDFTSSEVVWYSLTYQKTWWVIATGGSTEYLTAHNLLFSWIEKDQIYTFSVNMFDRAGNLRSVTGDVLRMTSWQIISTIYIVPVTNESVLSWTLATLASILKIEVEKFNACKNALTYTPIELEIRRNTFLIQMPNFKKSQMKTLVNAFTLFILDKLKHDYKISKNDIDEITKKFDSFLVILKLLRDDDNVCKQNLSNYHISQFQDSLKEFKISLE